MCSGGGYTRYGEHTQFLRPWACAEVVLGGLITQSVPGVDEAAGVTPTTH